MIPYPLNLLVKAAELMHNAFCAKAAMSSVLRLTITTELHHKKKNVALSFHFFKRNNVLLSLKE